MTRKAAPKSHVPITMASCHWNHIHYCRFFSLENLGVGLMNAGSPLSHLLNNFCLLLPVLETGGKIQLQHISCKVFKGSPLPDGRRLSIFPPPPPNILSHKEAHLSLCILLLKIWEKFFHLDQLHRHRSSRF